MRIKPDASEGAASSSTSPEISGHPSKSFSDALERSKRETQLPPFPTREQAVQTLRERIRAKSSAPKEMEGESDEEMPATSSSSASGKPSPPMFSRSPSSTREPSPRSMAGESDEEMPATSSRSASREPSPPMFSRSPSSTREPPPRSMAGESDEEMPATSSSRESREHPPSSTRSSREPPPPSQGTSREPLIASKRAGPSKEPSAKGHETEEPAVSKKEAKVKQPVVHAKEAKAQPSVTPSDIPTVKKQKTPEQPVKPVAVAGQTTQSKKGKEVATPPPAPAPKTETKVAAKALPQEEPQDSEVEEGGAVSALGEGELKKKEELLRTTSQSKVEEVQRTGPQVQIQAVQGAMLGEMGAAQASAPTSGASPVDQIVAIMQNNQFFSAPVQQITVAKTATETTVAVALQNGVRVSLQIAAGGKDVNIVIQGISAQAQAAIDNPANRLALNEKLASQGFTVHQMQTFRSDTPQPPPGQQAFRGYEREGGEQQQRRRQEEPEAPEPVEGEE
ncbi:MAG: hypothetical protein JSR80_00760 [Verrucomicrobia bacterium]|nr:hypothetical protein [Verrucomicrobiota bacterium]